ncbi:MAG: hypothetical protein WCB79_00590 [Halobacteriota archaeon]
MAPNFCARYGVKVIPEQTFCKDCDVLLTTAPTNIVTNDSAQLSIAPSSTAQPDAHSIAPSSTARLDAHFAASVLGITGGVLGVLIGALFLVLFLGAIQSYYAGYYSENAGPFILLLGLEAFGILAFSILGALGAAQKLEAKSTVNAGGLFLAGVVVLLCMLSIATPMATGNTSYFKYSLAYVLAGLVISVLFFLSGYLLLRKPASQ